jgi:hypothetical protein
MSPRFFIKGIRDHEELRATSGVIIMKSKAGRQCTGAPGIGLVFNNPCGWVGHVSPKHYRRPGTKGFAFIYFLHPEMHSTYTKIPRRPRQVPGQFPNRLEVIHKNIFGWVYK